MFLYQPPTPPRARVVFAGKVSDSTARGTVDFVGKRLPPVNPEILRSVKQSLQSPGTNYRERVIEGIKSDPSLFLQVAKRLPTVVEEDLSKVNPLDALAQLENDRLARLFEQPFPASHSHKLAQMSKQQALSLKVTIACAKYAEALAQSAHLSANSGYSNALFQQIGLNIISWNYPAVYSRAMARHRAHGDDPHLELERVLGVSPRALGLRLAQQWGITLVSSVQEDQSSQEMARILNLAEICARCEDPYNYPEAERLLERREKELSELLGATQIEKIKSEIDLNLQSYEKVSPTVAAISRSATTSAHGSPLFLPEFIVQRNPALTRLDPSSKAAFAKVYEKLEQGRVSVDALKILVEISTPQVGFHRGCLFLSTAANGTLQPALRFGEYPLSAYRRYLLSTGSCIRGSLDMLTPLRMDGIGISGEVVSFLCAGLNHIRHEGVLYLEIAPEVRTDPEFRATLLFQAVRQSLKDCLDGV